MTNCAGYGIIKIRRVAIVSAPPKKSIGNFAQKKCLDFSKHSENVFYSVGSACPILSVSFLIIEQNVERVVAEVLLWSSVRYDVDFVPLNRRKMFLEPSHFYFGNGSVVFFRSTLAQPRDNCEIVAVSLQGVKSASESCKSKQRLCICVRVSIFCDEVVEPILYSLKVCDCSIHVKVDCNV